MAGAASARRSIQCLRRFGAPTGFVNMAWPPWRAATRRGAQRRERCTGEAQTAAHAKAWPRPWSPDIVSIHLGAAPSFAVIQRWATLPRYMHLPVSGFFSKPPLHVHVPSLLQAP
jgi:hypothetical protein